MVALVRFIEANFKENLPSALVTLGAVITSLHYPSIKKNREGVPIPVLYGIPGSQKSTLVSLCLAAVGVNGKFQGNCFRFVDCNTQICYSTCAHTCFLNYRFSQ